MSDANSEYPTTLGADAVFKGHLQFKKGVRLLGKFEGEINSNGQLLIAEGATLTGDVKANAIRVEGRVKGNLDADAKVQLSGSARLEGDLQTQRLEVAEGAVLIGKVVVGVNGKGAGVAGKDASKAEDAVIPSKSKAAAAILAGAKK